MLIYLSSAWHPSRYFVNSSIHTLLIQVKLSLWTILFLILCLVDYFYGGPLVFWSAYGLDSLLSGTRPAFVIADCECELIESAASFRIFFQKILSLDGCMWMCVDGQRLVHLFPSLAIFTSGKERLLEVESKTQQAGQLLEGGQLASAPHLSNWALSTHSAEQEQEQEELELYSICDMNLEIERSGKFETEIDH